MFKRIQQIDVHLYLSLFLILLFQDKKEVSSMIHLSTIFSILFSLDP